MAFAGGYDRVDTPLPRMLVQHQLSVAGNASVEKDTDDGEDEGK